MAGLLSRVSRRLAGRVVPPLMRRLLLARGARVRFAGLDLVVDPGVFPPVGFGSTAMLAAHVAALPLAGKRLLEVGTGSGAIALAAARAGARVTATDIDPAAVSCAAANATRNGLALEVVESDLLAALPPDLSFDYVVFNPPQFPRPQTDRSTRAWHVGEGFDLIRRFAGESTPRLRPGGRLVVLLSADMDLERILSFFGAEGLRSARVLSRKWYWDTYHVYHFGREPRAAWRPSPTTPPAPPARLLLRGGMLPPHGQRGAIRIRSGRIEEVAGDLRAQSGERLLDLDGLAVLPGLVNAHDHLDLDLLPRLGDPPYGNSYQWLDDLVRKRPRAGVDLARVSRIDRIAWGAYRNLFGGVTTVAHHGPLPLPAVLASGRLPVRLRLPFAWSDSLREPDAISRGRRAQGRMPFAIHLADGTDEMAARELDALDRAGLLGRGTVIVHGVALDADGCRRLGESGAALVWCPRTSHFLFGTTAPVAEVPAGTAVALGTDSTMTGSVTLLDELRFAASLGLVDGERLLAMVTAEAARALALPDHGAIRPGAVADLIALPAAPTAAEALLRATPGSLALVMVGGRLRLAAPRFARGLDLEPAVIEGAARFVAPGFGDLVGRIRSALPADFESPALASLAGGVPSR